MTSEMPCFAAQPERGRTRPAWPAGISTAMPVPTLARAPGSSARRLGRVEVEPGVASCARGTAAWRVGGQALRLGSVHASGGPLTVNSSKRCASAFGTLALHEDALGALLALEVARELVELRQAAPSA